MPISNTVRAFDGGLYINADGFQCDKHGIPLVSATGTIIITTVGTSPEGVQSANQGVFLYDTTSQQLWIKSSVGTGTTGWTQIL